MYGGYPRDRGRPPPAWAPANDFHQAQQGPPLSNAYPPPTNQRSGSSSRRGEGSAFPPPRVKTAAETNRERAESGSAVGANLYGGAAANHRMANGHGNGNGNPSAARSQFDSRERGGAHSPEYSRMHSGEYDVFSPKRDGFRRRQFSTLDQSEQDRVREKLRKQQEQRHALEQQMEEKRLRKLRQKEEEREEDAREAQRAQREREQEERRNNSKGARAEAFRDDSNHQRLDQQPPPQWGRPGVGFPDQAQDPRAPEQWHQQPPGYAFQQPQRTNVQPAMSFQPRAVSFAGQDGQHDLGFAPGQGHHNHPGHLQMQVPHGQTPYGQYLAPPQFPRGPPMPQDFPPDARPGPFQQSGPAHGFAGPGPGFGPGKDSSGIPGDHNSDADGSALDNRDWRPSTGMDRPHTAVSRGQLANMTQREREQMFNKDEAQAQLKRDLDAQIAEKARRKREEEEKDRRHQV